MTTGCRLEKAATADPDANTNGAGVGVGVGVGTDVFSGLECFCGIGCGRDFPFATRAECVASLEGEREGYTPNQYRRWRQFSKAFISLVPV